jgi:hypothetical protein
MQKVDVHCLARRQTLALPPHFLGDRFEDPDGFPLRIGVQAGHDAAHGQRLVSIEPEPLGDDRRPQGEYRSAVHLHADRGAGFAGCHRRDSRRPAARISLAARCYGP